MTRHFAVALRLVIAGAVLFTLMSPTPAVACSCAEPSLEAIVDRHPGAAVAVVRRIDRDAGTNGVGLVEHTLRGELPEQVPLQLDDGGSCRPYLGVGQVATLSFEPLNGSWQTVDCGMLDSGTTFAQAFGALTTDPEARGDPAAALAVNMPGGGVVLLDRRLAVLAVAEMPGIASVDACGDHLVVASQSGPDGRHTDLSLLSLPDLDTIEQRRLRGSGRHRQYLHDVSCTDGPSVAGIVISDGDELRHRLYRDLFGGQAIELPAAADVAIAGDEVLLLRSDADAQRSTLDAYQVSTGETTRRRSFDDMDAYGLGVSPSGRHTTIRGFAEDSVLLVLDTKTGELTGRAVGSWLPPEHDAWVDDEHLLLRDEDRAMGDPAAGSRIVDIRLAVVEEVPPMASSRLVAGHGAVAAVGGAELTIAPAGRSPTTSTDVRTAVAGDVAVLGEIAQQAQSATALPEPQPGVEPSGRVRWLGLAVAAVVGGAAIVGVAAGVGAAVRSRRVSTRRLRQE